jgi:hypothetical protein
VPEWWCPGNTLGGEIREGKEFIPQATLYIGTPFDQSREREPTGGPKGGQKGESSPIIDINREKGNQQGDQKGDQKGDQNAKPLK